LSKPELLTQPPQKEIETKDYGMMLKLYAIHANMNISQPKKPEMKNWNY